MDIRYPQKKMYVKLIENQPKKPPIVLSCANQLGHDINRIFHTKQYIIHLNTCSDWRSIKDKKAKAHFGFRHQRQSHRTE